jgi:mono/diheme cytochrome c family protein
MNKFMAFKQIVNSMVIFVFIFIMIFSIGKSYALSKYSAAENRQSGAYLFKYYNCLDCHTINSVGGTLGPSLSHYGSKHKSFIWTATQIADPSSHFKLGSQVTINGKKYYVLMPSYTYISSVNAGKIASYLESLK